MFKLVVLSVVLAVAAANPIALWGAGLAGPLAGWGAPWAGAGVGAPWAGAGVGAPLAGAGVGAPLAGAGLAVPLAGAAPVGAYNYRGPLSLAPGQPANILAADGRPLDTLSVNLDRAVHYTARALEGGRQKRSVVAAPVAAGHLVGAHYAAPLAATHLAAAPLTLGRSWVGPAPIAPFAIAAAAPVGLGYGPGLANIW